MGRTVDAWPHYPSARGTIASGVDPSNPQGWTDNLDLIQLLLQGKMDEPAGLGAGDMFYYDGTEVVRLPKGTSGQALHQGASSPVWSDRDPTFQQISVLDSTGAFKSGSPLTAESPTDTWSLKEGSGITLTVDPVTKIISVAAPGAGIKEVHVPIFFNFTGHNVSGASFGMLSNIYQIKWDPAKWPSGMQWYLEAVMATGGGGGSVNLFRYDNNTIPTNYGGLGTSGGLTYPFAFRSAALTMPATEQFLTVAAKKDTGTSITVYSARLIGVIS